MILTEAEIKNLIITYHGNDAFILGVAVGESIEFRKAYEWIKSNLDKDEGGEIEYCFRKAMEE